MAIRFQCPGCSRQLTVPEDVAGLEGNCPHCKAIVQVPGNRQTNPVESADQGSGNTYGRENSPAIAFCPACGQMLALPAGKGRVSIQCSVCAASLEAESGNVFLSPTAVAEGDRVWHLVLPDEKRYGPVTESWIITQIQKNLVPEGALVWRQGMREWTAWESTYPFSQHALPLPQARHAERYGETVAPVRTSGLAVASMILSIVGLFLFYFGFIADLIGLILGAVALKQIDITRGLQGRGMALAGLIIGVIGVALSIFWAFFFIAAFREAFRGAGWPWPG